MTNVDKQTFAGGFSQDLRLFHCWNWHENSLIVMTSQWCQCVIYVNKDLSKSLMTHTYLGQIHLHCLTYQVLGKVGNGPITKQPVSANLPEVISEYGGGGRCFDPEAKG